MYITFAPVHSKSHIKALKNLPSYSVNSEVHRTELLVAKKKIIKKSEIWIGDNYTTYF